MLSPELRLHVWPFLKKVVAPIGVYVRPLGTLSSLSCLIQIYGGLKSRFNAFVVLRSCASHRFNNLCDVQLLKTTMSKLLINL